MAIIRVKGRVLALLLLVFDVQAMVMPLCFRGKMDVQHLCLRGSYFVLDEKKTSNFLSRFLPRAT